MWCFLLIMMCLNTVKQAQAKTGRLCEHWFALGRRSMINPSGGKNLLPGRRRMSLKTEWFPADLLLARQKILLRRKHHINGS